MKGHKAHHHGKKEGGRLPMKAAGNPEVFKEAEEDEDGGEMKRGGKVKRKAGGRVKNVGFMTGGAVKPRMDRPGRKRGGRVGADNAPLSSAHNVTSAAKETHNGEPD